MRFLLPAIALTVCACTNNEKIRVACVGDSITEGFGIRMQSENAYPAQLGDMLGDKYEVMNFGRSSTTMMQTGDFPYWTAKEFSNALRYKADIYVIKLGTNDCKSYQWNAEKFKESYLNMIDTLRSAAPESRIILCLPVPVVAPKWAMNDSVIFNGVIPMIREVADERSLEIVDLYATFAPHLDLIFDSVHPNKEGAHLLAQTVAEAIE